MESKKEIKKQSSDKQSYDKDIKEIKELLIKIQSLIEIITKLEMNKAGIQYDE